MHFGYCFGGFAPWTAINFSHSLLTCWSSLVIFCEERASNLFSSVKDRIKLLSEAREKEKQFKALMAEGKDLSIFLNQVQRGPIDGDSR